MNLGFWYKYLLRPELTRFIGLDHYYNMLRDSYYWQSLENTFLWTVGSVCFQFLFGLALALCLNERFKGRGIYRTLVLVPWIVPTPIAGFMWKWMFNEIGVISDILMRIGLWKEPVLLLGSKEWSLPVLLVINIWRGTPFFAVMLLAALQAVPPDLYEAAHIDGASVFRRFTSVVLPSIRFTILVSLMLNTIWAFNFIDFIILLTMGGPGGRTLTLPAYSYITAFGVYDLGYAGALSGVVSLFLVFFTLVYVLFMKREGMVV